MRANVSLKVDKLLLWAVTVHKLQGNTLERAVIDLGKKTLRNMLH